MFGLTAGIACALLFIATLLLLGYTLWELAPSDREDPPQEPGQRARQPAPPTQTRLS